MIIGDVSALLSQPLVLVQRKQKYYTTRVYRPYRLGCTRRCETMDSNYDMADEQESVHRPSHLFSRRQILKLGGISIVGASAFAPLLARSATKPLIIMEKAQGIVIADPATCVGCGRCELACTEFNDGKAAPTLSRIKVDRNANFGSDDLFAWREGQGVWGNGLIIQDLCKQCPHPVPCADICPEDAIVVAPSTGARMINMDRCTGCKICLKACPWEMISFDPDSRKATKCHLCNGKPKCVEACPADSLSYVPWRDLTGKIPPRVLPQRGHRATEPPPVLNVICPVNGKMRAWVPGCLRGELNRAYSPLDPTPPLAGSIGWALFSCPWWYLR